MSLAHRSPNPNPACPSPAPAAPQPEAEMVARGSSAAHQLGGVLGFADAAHALPSHVTARSRSGQLFDDCYTVSHYLGAGSTSVVCYCTDIRTGEAVAVKAVSLAPTHPNAPTQTEALSVLKEATLLSRVSHLPMVPTLREVFQEDDRWYVVTELAEGKELLELVAKAVVPEAEARAIAQQLLKCLAELHAAGVVHRDVKLENILVSSSDSQLRLVDFGLAGSLPSPSHKTLHEVCGTPQFVAPEVLQRSQPYGSSCDLWSAGVCLYALLSGAMPFPQTELYALLQNIRTGGYSFDSSAWDSVSIDAKDLVMRLLDTDPNTRLTAKQALSHRWFQS